MSRDRCADCGTEWKDGHWCDTGPDDVVELEQGTGYTRPLRPFVRVFLAWYDMWVGAYWSRRSRILYVCPLPCLVVRLDFRKAHTRGCRCGAMTASTHFHWCQFRPKENER